MRIALSAAFVLSVVSVLCALPFARAEDKAADVAEIATTDAGPALYVKSFGQKDLAPPPIVFLHGGPGHNAALFELSTAEMLSKKARVVVYDRAGCGRSEQGTAGSYSYEGAIADLARVMEKEGIKKPLLVGHSFGGTLALEAFDRHPDRYAGVVLTGAPISYPDAFALIIERSRAFYEEIGNEHSLRSLDQLEKLDPKAGFYASGLFGHAQASGLYAPKQPTPEARKMKERLRKESDVKLVSAMQMAPYWGFLQSEKHTVSDASKLIVKHKQHVFAIYGGEDWALGNTGRAYLEKTLPEGHATFIEHASHAPFADRQSVFLDAMDAVLAELRRRVPLPPPK